MGSRQNNTTLAKRTKDGSEVVAQQNCAEIDTPVLPPPEVIERIQACRPDLIDWMISETSKEAENRRQMERQRMDTACNGFKTGQICGLIVGLSGIIGGSMVAIFSSSPTAGASIASCAIVVLAVAFVTGKHS